MRYLLVLSSYSVEIVLLSTKVLEVLQGVLCVLELLERACDVYWKPWKIVHHTL